MPTMKAALTARMRGRRVLMLRLVNALVMLFVKPEMSRFLGDARLFDTTTRGLSMYSSMAAAGN